VTCALADMLARAELVAVTVYVPLVLGAVYNPLVEIVPPVVDQVTAVFVVPLIVTPNCCVPPVVRETEVGETVMVSVCATAC
jgi:hypothetical protein